MLIRKASDIKWFEITDETVYRNRRQFLKAGSLAFAGAAASTLLPGCLTSAAPEAQQAPQPKGPYDAKETPTPYQAITTYNNYYEFGAQYQLPARNAQNFKTKPWTVKVEGMVKKPATWDLNDLLKGLTPEDRIYRMRCVEGWSMVIPWLGIPLKDIVNKLEPTPSAKFIEMTTILDPVQMPEQKTDLLPWPYTEGLRLDEATNPLALFAVGIYGKPLPNQNGAPIRLVTPWKYGFKGVKAIVNIRFTDKQPNNTWAIANPFEYGFYANVNPNVDHPRWTQKTERPIGQKLTLTQIAKGEVPIKPTLMFNGYSDQVASMYAGMDLKKLF
jgi:methionine sulfoxide reductase catalytic subunit